MDREQDLEFVSAMEHLEKPSLNEPSITVATNQCEEGQLREREIEQNTCTDTPSSTAPTCAPTLFYPFGRLPIELRLKIWKETLPGPRLVPARFCTNVNSYNPGPSLVDFQHNHAEPFDDRLLYVCKESRSAFFEVYTVPSAHNNVPLNVRFSGYIDPKLDTLQIDVKDYVDPWRLYNLLTVLDFSRVEKLALKYSDSSWREFVYARKNVGHMDTNWSFVNRSFPKLREFTFVIHPLKEPGELPEPPTGIQGLKSINAETIDDLAYVSSRCNMSWDVNFFTGRLEEIGWDAIHCKTDAKKRMARDPERWKNVIFDVAFPTFMRTWDITLLATHHKPLKLNIRWVEIGNSILKVPTTSDGAFLLHRYQGIEELFGGESGNEAEEGFDNDLWRGREEFCFRLIQ